MLESSFILDEYESVEVPEVHYDERMEARTVMRTMLVRKPKSEMSSGKVQRPINPKKIRVIRNMGLGDVVMASVTVRALRAHYPKAHITYAVNPEFVELFRRMPYADEVVEINDLRKKEDGETVYDLRMMVEPRSIGGLIPNEVYNAKNRIDIFLDSVGMFGEQQTTEMFIEPKDILWAHRWLQSLTEHKRNLMGVQFFCHSVYRSWPPEYFREFISNLDRQLYMPIVFGDTWPWPSIEYSVNHGATVDMLGKTTVGQACALVGMLNSFVGIDSGLLHVAAALGVPTLALFGAVRPDLRLRYYESVIALTPEKNLNCAYCNDGADKTEECTDTIRKLAKKSVGAPCMRGISPTTALAALDRLNVEGQRCPLCRGISKYFGSKQGHVIKRCRLCGFVFCTPMPDDDKVRAVYGTETYWSPDSCYLRGREVDTNHEARVRRLAAAGSMTKQTHLLDAGCGQGGFVKYLRKNGFTEAFGIDYMVKHHEPFLEVRSIFEEKRKFEAVTLMEVCEHVYDGMGLFRRLNKLLVPGGRLYIESSDTNRVMKNGGFGTVWFDPPIHCVSYDLRSLEFALNAAGFEMTHDFSTEVEPWALIVVAKKIAEA